MHDARNRLSALVEAAQKGRPQLITKRGAPAVVVMAATDSERIETLEVQRLRSITDHLLAMPQDDGTFEPIETKPRDMRL